jgi:hypothetical protein
MREKLNENPVAQIAVVAVLVVAVGYLLLSSMGGGSESSESSGATAEVSTSAGGEEEAAPETSEGSGVESSAPAAATSGASAPSRPLPHDVEVAYQQGDTVALLIYRPGGIDDHSVTEAASVIEEFPGVAFFSAPVGKIARYSAITGPLGVNQAPALIVIRPKRLNGDAPAPATVDYGFQSAADLRQEIVDAGYKGPQLTYAPN